MTTDRETTRFVVEWLEEGEARLPDRVLDAVLDRVPVTPQRRRWSLARLFSSPILATGAAAAALLVAALVGLSVLLGPNLGAPAPSPDASPSPTEAARLDFWAGTEVPAGIYRIDDPFPVPLTLRVPDGWTVYGVGETLAAICSNDCELPERIGLAVWVVTNVYTDACDRAALADPPIGGSVDDLVTALTRLPRHTATSPAPDAIDGIPARYLELVADDGLGDCALRGFRAWSAGAEFRESPPGDRDRLWVLEVDGVRLMIDIAHPDGASPDLLADLEALVDSIRFDR
jgi:hypothetical protein